MKYKFTLQSGVLLLLVVGTGVFGCQQKSTGSTGQTARVSWSGEQAEAVNDPMFGMTAATIHIPSGWKFAGGVARPAGCHAPPIAWLSTTAQAQDGITARVSLPSVTWNSTSSPAMKKIMAEKMHCPDIDITTAAGFLVNIAIPNLHRNAKIVSVLSATADTQARLATELATEDQQTAAQRMQRFSHNHTLDGARVRIQYLGGGQALEEMISAEVDCTEATGVALFGSREPPPENRGCRTNGTLIVRAPQGHLDEVLAAMEQPHFKDMIKASQVNHDWFMRAVQDKQASFDRATAEFNRQSQQIRDAGQAAEDQLVRRATAGREQNERVSRDSRAQAQAAQAATDAAAHQTVNYALDRRDFTNPNTGQTINVSGDYNHQWLSSDGSTLIQTNDHGFDPNGQVYPVSQSWTELVPH